MPEDKQGASKGPFIPAELRPPVGPDLEQVPPLEPGASQEEIQRRASEIMDESQRTRLGLADGDPPPEIWKTIFTKSPDVEWAVLDKEAVLLNLETGAYYTLNRVGAVMWELCTGDQPLEKILAVMCERFDVVEEVAREDLVALVARLRQEGLIVERR